MTDFLDRVERDQCEHPTQTLRNGVWQCDKCREFTSYEHSGCMYPPSPLGATDALDALPTTRDEREALRARGEAAESAVEQDPHVPAGPRCRACGSIHGVWVKVHWKPGAEAGDKPCPEGFRP